MLRAVLKIGGSLGRDGALPGLCRVLAGLGQEHPLLVVPGGGFFADAVRDCHGRFPMSEDTAHWMAILGMDQYGLLLAGLIPGARTVTDLACAESVAEKGRVPVLLPSELLRRHDPLPHSWDVTSDSIAAWIAARSKAALCVLLKDTDGLCDADPHAESSGGATARLRPVMTLAELAACRGVDRHLPRVLAGSGLECWAIDGRRPERLAGLLATGSATGTRIPPQEG